MEFNDYYPQSSGSIRFVSNLTRHFQSKTAGFMIRRRFVRQPPHLIITDFDGCLTNDHVYLNEEGTEFVRVTRKDGLGASRLKLMGIDLLILSSESNLVVSRRARKIGVQVQQGVPDKGKAFQDILMGTKYLLENIWYIGNDVNDLPPIRMASFSLCPKDSAIEVRQECNVVLPVLGGSGILNYLASLLESETS
jgi:YrbI family 3-deoxy-D-manno-octulosonate 8-phosphate phosphatase